MPEPGKTGLLANAVTQSQHFRCQVSWPLFDGFVRMTVDHEREMYRG